MKSLKVNAVLNAIKTLMNVIFPLISFPYVSRILMPEGIGKVNFSLSIISYFAIIASLGIEHYGAREAAKKRDNKIELSQFVKEVFIINLFSTFVAYILLTCAIFFVPKLSDYRLLLIVTGSSILFTTIGMNWLYVAEEDYFYITVRTIAFQILSLILLFIFVRSKDDYIKYAGITVIANCGSNLLNLFHSRKYLDFRTGLSLGLAEHIKPIMIFFASCAASTLCSSLDTTMLGGIKGDWDVGIYSSACKINRIVLGIVISVSSVLLPRLSYYYEKNEIEKYKELVYKGFNFLFVIALPCAVGLSLLSDTVINIFVGKKFEGSIIPMVIMNSTIVIIGLSSYISGQILNPTNNEKWCLISVCTGALINFGVNLLLIPRFGVIGAAIATVISELIIACIQLGVAKRFIQISILFKFFIKYFVNSLIMGAAVILVKTIFCNDFIKLIIGILTGILIYTIMLLIEKDVLFFEYLRGIKSKFLKK